MGSLLHGVKSHVDFGMGSFDFSLKCNLKLLYSKSQKHQNCERIYAQILFHPQFEVAIFSTYGFLYLYISVESRAYT